jgi:tape measure domain-containing protein
MSLEFRIELTGNFAGALEKGAAATDKASDATAKHRKEVELFEAEIGKAKGEFGGFAIDLEAFAKGGSLFTFDLATALKGAVELAGALVEKFLDLGKEAVGVAGKVQDIDLAIELNVGKERAGAINELAESFERTTRFDAGDIKQALLPLLKQGVSDPQTLDTIATIGSDLAARSGKGIADVQETISAFAGIFQRGRLKPAQLAQFGIQASEYFAELGDTFGVSAAQAEKMAKKGELSGNQLAAVAAKMVAAKQGGAIGDPTNKSDEKIGATLARLSNLKENMFETIAKSDAMNKIQQGLERIIALFKGDLGAKIMGTFERVLSFVGDGLLWLTSDDGLGKIGAVISAIGETASNVGGVFVQVWGAIEPVISPLWTLLKQLWEILAAYTSAAILPGLKLAWEGLLFVLNQVAKALAEIIGGLSKVIDLGKDIVSGQLFKDIGDALSGEHGGIAKGGEGPKGYVWDEATQGYKPIPKMAAGGVVTGPTLAMVGEAGPEAIVPLDRAGGLGNQITVTYAPVYQASGGNASELRAELEQIERASRIEFKRVIDELLAS